MNCPKCRAKMTLLFTSAVCDVCDPPLVAGTTTKSAPVTKYLKMWIYFAGNVKDYFTSGTGTVRPRLTRDEAYRSSEHRGSSHGQYYQVYYTNLEKPELVFAAWACPDERQALYWVPRGNNSVWLVD